MPRAVVERREHRFLPRAEILRFEEIVRIVRVASALGVRKVRITGGEPLLRKDLPALVSMLAELSSSRSREGQAPFELALTSNGAFLAQHASALAQAGLERVTVSLDSLDPKVFSAMSDTDVSVTDVLAGIDAARAAGLTPIKINCVVRRGLSESSIVPLARHFRGTGSVVRFIELMDVGTHNGWSERDVLPAHEVLARIDAVFPLEPVAPTYAGEVATRYRYRDGGGEIGVIASVSAPFCGDCTRARVSADGHLYTCLFSSRGVDLRPALRDERSSADDEALAALFQATWRARDDRYSERRAAQAHRLPLAREPNPEPQPEPKIEMSYIGG